MTNSKNLIILGVGSFAAFLAYLYATSAPQREITPVAARVVAPELAEYTAPAEASAEPEPLSADGEWVMPDPEDVDFATALDDGGYFDDSSYPETDDDLLVIEEGDPTRYVTEADRAEEQARQQRAKESSLNAAGYVGDDRLRAISTLGSYAAEGNAYAVAELRDMLQSSDAELRADALDALAELLPDTNIVPAFAAEPPTDSDIDGIIKALQARQ